MTNEQKITMLECMTDVTDPVVLSTYLELAAQIVYEKAFPWGNYPDEMPSRYDGVHVEIAAYQINKRGAEGETVHLENGVSRHWEDGSIPSSLLRRITPMASPIFMKKEDPDETGETEP